MTKSRSFKRTMAMLLLSMATTLMLICPCRAQSTDVHRIGVLTPGGAFVAVVDGLRQGLAQLGYAEGKQVSFIVEDKDRETLDLVKAATRLLEAKPRLIFTVLPGPTAAAKQVAGNLPIVFTLLSDPVRLGYVASYVSSKNNLTGVSNNSSSLSGKRLEVLKEIAPGIRRVLAVVPIKEPGAEISFANLDEAAKKFGVEIIRRDVTTKEDIEKVLLNTRKGSVDAISHVPSALGTNSIELFVDKANKDKLPFGVHSEELVKKGALVSYGDDFRLIGIQAARLVAKILKGISPSDIPIETPDRPLLVVNRATAKTIGLKIPNKFFEHVDRVVD